MKEAAPVDVEPVAEPVPVTVEPVEEMQPPGGMGGEGNLAEKLLTDELWERLLGVEDKAKNKIFARDRVYLERSNEEIGDDGKVVSATFTLTAFDADYKQYKTKGTYVRGQSDSNFLNNIVDKMVKKGNAGETDLDFIEDEFAEINDKYSNEIERDKYVKIRGKGRGKVINSVQLDGDGSDITDKIIEFAQNIRDKKINDPNKENRSLGEVSEKAVMDILRILGIDITGYAHNFNGGQVVHTEIRHGVKGEADESMADINKYGLIKGVLDNYDTTELLLGVDKNIM